MKKNKNREKKVKAKNKAERKTVEAKKAEHRWIGKTVLCILCLLSVTWLGLAAAGCGIEDTNGSKIEDVEFTVLEEEAVPEELKQEIEERKEMDFKLTYEDNGKLYIARGYGEKETGGYSISVKDVYLTQNALCFVTTLIGPGENETVAKAPSFPYIVVEVTKCDKNVVFE
ncbi:protease complex subunit PrcB family protein [Thermoguttaceae bacterium LCP21S3_D4]